MPAHSNGNDEATAGCSSEPPALQVPEVSSSGQIEIKRFHKVTPECAKVFKGLARKGLLDKNANGNFCLGPAGIEAVKAAYEVYIKSGNNSNMLWFSSHDLLVVFRKKEK